MDRQAATVSAVIKWPCPYSSYCEYPIETYTIKQEREIVKMNNSVKAAVLVEPERMEIREFPYPNLEKGCAIMRMEMSGICGTDKDFYKGNLKKYDGIAADEYSTPFPIIQGHENVGIIEEIDEEASKHLEFYGLELKPGDRVVMCPDVNCGKCYYCRRFHGYPWCENLRAYGCSYSCAVPPHLFGGWSEFMYLKPNVKVYKVPDGIGPEVAVFAELMANTYSLDKAKEFSAFDGEGFAFADIVVIQGAGPLGMCHLIKARMIGADKVIMIDKSDFRLHMAKEFGADITISMKNTTLKDRIEIVRGESGGRGADIVVECAGEPEAIPEGIDLIRNAGMYLELGNFADKKIPIEINASKICAKNARIIGLSNHPITGYTPSLTMLKRYRKEFPIEKLITHKFSVDDALKGMLKSMEPDTMKCVIAPGQ